MKFICMVILLSISLLSNVFSQDISGNYAIKNVKTGMLLRVKDASSKNGTPIVAYAPQNWKCMTWNFKSAGGNTYQLENLLTHKTFQPQASDNPVISLEEQPLLVGNPQQQYEFTRVEKGTFLIKMKGTDLYLTPSDPKGEINSSIILAKRNTTDLQYWTIYEQSPTM